MHIQGIEVGRQAGPAIDPTAPYLNGPNAFLQMHGLRDPDDARRQVAYWAEMGATSFKTYSGSVATILFGSSLHTLAARRFDSQTDPRPKRIASPPSP